MKTINKQKDPESTVISGIKVLSDVKEVTWYWLNLPTTYTEEINATDSEEFTIVQRKSDIIIELLIRVNCAKALTPQVVSPCKEDHLHLDQLKFIKSIEISTSERCGL